MRHLKTEGIVLARRNVLEKDTLIVLFTKEKGKIAAIAKGVKNIKSRRLPALMTGNLVNLVLYQRNDRSYVQEASIISLFSRIKKEEALLHHLYLVLFVLNELLPPGQREDAIYTLLMKFLIELSKGGFTRGRMAHYLDAVLAQFGYGDTGENLDDILRKTEGIIGKKIPLFII